MPRAMIQLEEVSKKFAGRPVVDAVSFLIPRGEVVGFLGPNGAGKTTTLRLVIGYLFPTSGKIRVEGKNPDEEGLAVRSRVGYLAENNPLYVDLTVDEYLRFIAALKGIEKEGRAAEIENLADLCGLNEVFSQTIAELSRGYKQRVGLAAALLGDPPILILDEPTSGLDPNQIIEIRNLIKNLGQTKTIILSTHIIPEVVQTCSRVIIINKGKIVADEKASDFRGEAEFHQLTKERQL